MVNDLYKIIRHILPELFNEDKAFKSILPKVTRFQILTILATTWAFIFAQMTMNFLHYGITLTTSIIAHILVIIGIIFTRKSLDTKWNFNDYHSVGRQRGYTWARDKQGNPYKVPLDPNDPGGEHE